MRDTNRLAKKRHSEILSQYNGFNSTYRRELEDYRWYMGLLVTSNGLIIGERGVRAPTLKFKDGKIDKHEVIVRYKGKTTYRSYTRFLYAAFNEDFDIDDMNMVVVSTSDMRFERNVYKLKAITREEFFKIKHKQSYHKYYTDEEHQIYDVWKKVEGKMTQALFAERLGCTPVYLSKLIKGISEK